MAAAVSPVFAVGVAWVLLVVAQTFFAFRLPAVRALAGGITRGRIPRRMVAWLALSFVVADPGEPCTPSWGGYYSLDAAGETLDLDRRISQLRAAGGDVMVSLGGAANHELAVTCQDDGALLDAYRAVVERYDLRPTYPVKLLEEP